MDFREAEVAAMLWMRQSGLDDAVLTQDGADGGIDVTSGSIVAQVKAEQKPTGRPAVQKIHGAASAVGKSALFFSTAGYTDQAARWADGAGVALFRLNPDGSVAAENVHGERFVVSSRVTSTSVSDGDVVEITPPAPPPPRPPGTPHPPSDDSIEFDFRFTITDCEYCGAENPKAAGCRQCGRTAPAEDPHVAARRRAIENARLRSTVPEGPATNVAPEGIFNDLSDMNPPGRVADLLTTVDDADQAWESQYAALLRDFQSLRNRALHSTDRSKGKTPAEFWTWVDLALQKTGETINHYEFAATASTPDRAAAAVQEAQNTLDALFAENQRYFTEVVPRLQRSAQRGTGKGVSRTGCLLPATVLAGLASLFVALLSASRKH